MVGARTDQEVIEKLERLIGSTMSEVSDMSKDMAAVKHSQIIMAKAHEGLAAAAQSMADTFKRSEDRQVRLEQTNQDLYREKGVSPNVFYMVTGTLCCVIVLGAIWVTDTSVRATLTSFEAGKQQAENLEQAQDLKDARKELIQELKHGK